MKERTDYCYISEFEGKHSPAIGYCEYGHLLTEGWGNYPRIVENTPHLIDEINRMVERGEAQFDRWEDTQIIFLTSRSLSRDEDTTTQK